MNRLNSSVAKNNFNKNNNTTQEPLTFSAPEPLAIVGIGCRFPGASSGPEAFWQNLLDAKDCIVEVPDSRWDTKRFFDENRDKPGKVHVKSGGFLHEPIDEFDALFFGVSPRDADSLDPQQRLLMEVSWEAFEDAGIDADTLAGSDTGVFIGGFIMDNKLTQLSPLNRHTIASNTAAGMSLTMLSNRLSYTYDLRGPSVSMDTACSSSMVALDQACRSIWTGDSQMALVGGVNIMHRPEVFIAMCKGGFLSPDGRCKSFDERANGYGRGEGAGIVVVKPLAAAERDGDKIYSVIRATGCNQDGHTDGITVPNPESQKALIHKVSKKAEIDLKDIQFFEAHGTGTPVGDPLEMSAIGGTVGRAKDSGDTCIVGSVKGNIGHLEAASGIAAVIKTSLCLQNKSVPPQANLINLNTKIPFDQLQIKIPRQVEALNDKNGIILAGINSFGYGGTNACAILQNYVPPTISETDKDIQQIEGKRYLLPLSARSKPALKAVVKNYQQYIEHNHSLSLSDLTYSAGARRAQLTHRLAITANSVAELSENLKQYSESGVNDSSIETQINESRNKLAFVFTGMGPQWWAMGRELIQSEPIFLDSVKRCDLIFTEISGWSILDEMLKPEDTSIITETQVAQTANFVLQVGLVDLWASWGIEPSAVVGHSVGEVTTAYISGILSLRQALLVSYHRSRIQKKAAGEGAMLAVGMTEKESLELIEPYADKVSIAAINSPTAITLAGDEAILKSLSESLTGKDIFNRILQVEVAYHSPMMDPLLDEIEQCLAELSPQEPKLTSYSTVTGQEITGTSFGAKYWCSNVRQPVYFFKALEQMIADGFEDFIEIGPHPVLSSSIKECFNLHDVDGFLATSLKRKTLEQNTIKRAASELYGRGYKFNWRNLAADKFVSSEDGHSSQAISPSFIRLPTYPWQRERYWNDAQLALQDRVGQDINFAVLGESQAGPDTVWLSQVNQHFFKHLHDHKVENLVILAGATYVEAGLAAHKSLSGSDACLIRDLNLHNAMVIDSDDEPLMRTCYNKKDNSFTIHSYSIQSPTECTLHAAGSIETLLLVNNSKLDLHAIKSRANKEVNAEAIYTELTQRGLQYGEYFQGISNIWRRDNEVLAQITPHADLALPVDDYQLHPTLLDACFQSLISAIPTDSNMSEQVYVPVNIGQLRHYKKISSDFYCHGTLNNINDHEIIGDITLCDKQGNVLVEICELRCQALRAINEKTIDNLDDWTYQPTWKKLDPIAPKIENKNSDHYLLFIDSSEHSKTLIDTLQAKNPQRITILKKGDNFKALSADHYHLNALEPEHLKNLFSQLQLSKSNQVNVIYAWSMAVDENDPIHLDATSQLLNICKALESYTQPELTRLYVLTQDSAKVMADDKVIGFQQSPLIGLARVASVELPEFKCTVIDFENNWSTESADQLWLECQSNNSELELAYRRGQRFAYRLEHCRLAESYQPDYIKPADGQAFALSSQGIDGSEFQIIERQTPNSNSIELQVLSVAVDSNTLAINTDREVCARVVRTGSNTANFSVGDEIIARYSGALANYVTLATADILSIKKPSDWKNQEAAGNLSAFSVALSGLLDVARISEKSNILIIGSDSREGQAAVSIAQLNNCNYICVNDSNSDFNIASSNLTKDLSDYLTINTGKTGFDVVFNTFGEHANLHIDKLLANQGSYIVIENDSQPVKQPVLSATKIHVRLNSNCIINKNNTMLKTNLDRISEIISRVGVAEGISSKLNISGLSTWITDSQMPCTLTFDNINEIQVINKNSASISIKSNVSYLISGGFGGFGLGMAQWLVDQGAKSLILVSRSGAKNSDARLAVEDLVARGVEVKAAAIDISDFSSLEQLLEEVKQNMMPLAGIFHAAGVLDDREILSLDAESLKTVMSPKALGAWNLHRLTEDLSLDCFVLYSSISAMIGNRNQANYVAANLFLDNLAHYRQAKGLAATSINWGALADVGMAANNPSVIDHLAHVGIHAFSQQQALEAFSSLLQAPQAQLGIFNVNWQTWKKFEVASSQSRFSTLIIDDDRGENGDKWQGLLHQGEEILNSEIIETLSELISVTLKLSAEQVDIQTPINKFGLDSLMAMDLQMKFRGEFKVDVSILELMKGNSIAKLSVDIAKKLHLLSACNVDTAVIQEDDSSQQVVDNLVEQMNQLDEMSEEEIDALLEQELIAN